MTGARAYRGHYAALRMTSTNAGTRWLWWLLLAASGASLVWFGYAVSQRLLYPHELEWMEGALADHAARVVPMHSYKYAARLQAAQAGRNPVLLRVDTKAGHGAGTPTSKRIDLAADEWTFLVRALRMKVNFD